MKLHNTETIKKPRQPVSVRFHKIPIYGIFHYLRVIKCNEKRKEFFLWWFICCQNFWYLGVKGVIYGHEEHCDADCSDKLSDSDGSV